MSLLVIIFWGVACAVVFMVALTIFARVSTGIGNRRLQRYERATHDQLTAYVVGVRDDPPEPPQGRFEQRVLRRDLVALVPSVKGEAADRLGALFATSGLVEIAHGQLSARNSLTRIRAAEALGAMGVPESREWLVAELHHRDPLLRLACARALAGLGAAETMPEVMASLREVDAAPGDVEEILLAFGPDGVPFLRELLARGTARERRLAVIALGYVAPPNVLPDLRAALGDPDDELVAAAARALGQLGDSRAPPLLVDLLGSDRVWFVRVAAARALGALEEDSAARDLVRALADEHWDVRNAAAWALVQLDGAGLDAVVRAGNAVPDAGMRHYAGLLDVAWRMEAVIEQAARGDGERDVFVRRACALGVRARLDELAAGDDGPSGYATQVLGEPAPVA